MSQAVRVRTAQDIPASVRALEEVYAEDGYPVEGVDQAEKWLFPEGLIRAWVAGDPTNILGHATLCQAQNEAAASMLIERTKLDRKQVAVLARLFVVPAARGQKLGEALTRTAMEYARQRGLHVVLDVMAKDQAAIRLYERLGFVRLGTTMHTFGGDRQAPAYCYATADAMIGHEHR